MKKWYEEPIATKLLIVQEAKELKHTAGNVCPEQLEQLCKKYDREYDNSLYTVIEV